jgi:PTS system glucose-specific IIA component
MAKTNISELVIMAPMNGEVMPVSRMPDPVFAEKILGDGIAILPENGIVLSPVDGEFVRCSDTHHAYGIRTPKGLELLIHIGINTVELGGRGFKSHVKDGDKVTTGRKICTVDLDLLQKNKYLLHTAVIVATPDMISDLQIFPGKASAGSTIVMICRLKTET